MLGKKYLILGISIVLCTFIAVVIDLWYSISIVHTHLFYIPILLAGLWLYSRAIYIAAYFAILHIALENLRTGSLANASILRGLIFLLVAIVIGIIAEQNDRLKNELQKITNAMLDIVMQVRYDGNIEYITPSVETVLGFSPQVMKGTSLFRYIHPEDLPSVKTILKKAADEKKKFKMECRMCRAQGDYIWIESLGNTIQERPDACAICIIGSRNIDIRKEKEEKLKLDSFVDPLTGLHNRRFFYEIIAQEASKAKRLNYSICLISIDMNDFKKVNDLYGHVAGDQLLIDFAELTRNTVRKDVDYVFRFGGDEFVILLIGSEQKDAEKVMARLNAGIKEFTDIVTLAYGIVEINAGDFFDPDYFVNAADKIMYEHKQQMKGIK